VLDRKGGSDGAEGVGDGHRTGITLLLVEGTHLPTRYLYHDRTVLRCD
jgi:hypothetical protein